MEKFKMEIEGMVCEGCVRIITDVLEGHGAKNIRISLNTNKVEFEVDESSLDKVIEEINSLGYRVKNFERGKAMTEEKSSFDEKYEEVKKLAEKVEKDGGIVLSIYKEPFADNWQIFALLPLSLVKPTPFQRDLSPQHVDRLRIVINELNRFLDPIIVVRTEEGNYWTPNGNHRREAMVRLGKQYISCIIVPEVSVAYQILALNTEKAHNLKEKALEVIRMYKDLYERDPNVKEIDYAFQFEEAYLITLGIIYQRREKFAGSAYVPILKKVDNFLPLPMSEAFRERERRADLLEELDAVVEPIVESLRQRGFNQPFLKQAVISKVNPIKRKRIVDMGYDEVLLRIKTALEGLDAQRISLEELTESISEDYFGV